MDRQSQRSTSKCRRHPWRRRPPYAARLAAALADPGSWPDRPGTSADGTALTIWVLCGPDAWDVARAYVDAGALFALSPPGEDPATFDWTDLAGHPPILIRGQLSAAELGRLAAAILRDGGGRILSADGRRFSAGRAGDG